MSKVNREHTTTRLTITMFGRFQVEIDGALVKPHRPPDFRLLAYLLLQHDSPVDRNEAAICWKKEADTELWESDARASLARAVFTLTAKLGIEGRRLQKPQPQLLLFETAGVDLDLLTWEAGLAEGTLEALEDIAPLYRRPLLQGWDDLWVQQARERLRKDYVRALRSAARRATTHGEWKAALRAYALLFEIAPTNSETLRDHLQVLAARRRFKEMQRLYDAFVKRCEENGERVDPPLEPFYRDLRSAAERRGDNIQNGRLPTPLSRFIPRPTDVQEICNGIRLERLTTLTGAGGVGKTRLAIAAAEEIREEFYDRAWFIGLSELQNPAEVAMQTARALSLPETAGKTPTEEILAFLHTKEALLILDNCEHVLEASARLATTLLENCPAVRILTTSREPLRIVGEFVWRVPSLDFPEAGARVGPRTPAKFSAVRLLIERANRPQFPLKIDANIAEAAARICRRLDGIPLAIELAAVQISHRLHSFQHVADSLDASLAFLTEGSSTAPSRQQTLRAAIEWSYRLLSDAEQRVLACLGVFVGGFTEEAGWEVCGSPLLAAEEVQAIVEALVEKSLVEIRPSQQRRRYSLLQTIREFALECLERMPPSTVGTLENEGVETVSEATRRRHLDYYIALAAKAEPHLEGAEQARWFDLLDDEHDNILAALTWALHQSENESGLILAGGMAWFWYTRDHHRTGVQWLDAFLASATSAPVARRLKAIHWAGNIAYAQSDLTRARAFYEDGLAIRKQYGSPMSIAVGQASLANVIGSLGDHLGALTLFEANLVLFRAQGDLRNAGLSLTNMGMQAYALADYPRARKLHAESLALLQETQDAEHVAQATNNLVGAILMSNDWETARAMLPQSLRLCLDLGSGHRLVHCLINYVILAIHEREWQHAAILFGYEQALRDRIGYVLPKLSQDLYIQHCTTIQDQLPAARFRELMLQGEQMTEEELCALLSKV